MNREAIYATLFDLLKRTPGLNTVSRRLRHYEEVAAADQPALFMVQRREEATVVRAVPTKWDLDVDVYLYVHTGGDETQSPGQLLNPLLDSITDNLLPEPGLEEQTLGQLVSHCRISGPIETDEGTLGDQAVAVIPIHIVVPQ